ncbi:MAG: hypothetical protein HY875_11865 [Chloroflexi bacterium]|nr:hypothetical protein [Chloroflexota bacterium]
MDSYRGMVVVPPGEDLRAEIARVRSEARARVTEADLLVAALRDHVKDLRQERDRLLAELQAMREERRIERAALFIARGSKGQR